MDTITAADDMHARKMEAGSQALLAALRGKPGPDRLMWRESFLPANWRRDEQSMVTRHHLHRVGLKQEKHDRAERQRVPYRDPCPNCGVRADFGCKHQAAGW